MTFKFEWYGILAYRGATSCSEGDRSVLSLFENGRTEPWFYRKDTLILEKNALFVYCGFNSRLKCSFKSILEKIPQNFPLRSLSFACRTWNVYWGAPISRKFPAPKNSWFRACNQIAKGSILSLLLSQYIKIKLLIISHQETRHKYGGNHWWQFFKYDDSFFKLRCCN